MRACINNHNFIITYITTMIAFLTFIVGLFAGSAITTFVKTIKKKPVLNLDQYKYKNSLRNIIIYK